MKITEMTIKDHITACNENIKNGNMACAKEYFDLAWKEYASGNYDDTDEKQLFWLRDNFYHVGSGYGVTEEAEFYENAILAAAGL